MGSLPRRLPQKVDRPRVQTAADLGGVGKALPTMNKLHDPPAGANAVPWPPPGSRAWSSRCPDCGRELVAWAPTWFLAQEAARYWCARWGHAPTAEGPTELPGLTLEELGDRFELAAGEHCGGVGIAVPFDEERCSRAPREPFRGEGGDR